MIKINQKFQLINIISINKKFNNKQKYFKNDNIIIFILKIKFNLFIKYFLNLYF